MEAAIHGLKAAEIHTIQRIMTLLAGQDIPAIAGQLANLGNALQQQDRNLHGLQSKLAPHQRRAGVIQAAQTNGLGQMQMEHRKPILEYHCWADVDKLSNVRAKCGDWEIRFKDALKQSTRTSGSARSEQTQYNCNISGAGVRISTVPPRQSPETGSRSRSCLRSPRTRAGPSC